MPNMSHLEMNHIYFRMTIQLWYNTPLHKWQQHQQHPPWITSLVPGLHPSKSQLSKWTRISGGKEGLQGKMNITLKQTTGKTYGEKLGASTGDLTLEKTS